MKKNITIEFVNWYINAREAKGGANYLLNNFANDRERFLAALNGYANAFEKAFNYNPFEMDLANLEKDKVDKLEVDLYAKGNHFEEYSQRISNHMPRALLGSKNYLLFLKEHLGKDKASDEFFLRNEFIDWLKEEEEYTHGSANSYASYVAAVNKNILSKHFEEGSFFRVVKELVNQGNKTAIEGLFDPLISVIIRQAATSVVHKYKNGLIQYRNFLIVQLSEEDLVEEVEPLKAALVKVQENNTLVFLNDVDYSHQLTYDKEALNKIFAFRMITQDRCYGKVFFPISFLKKLFYKNESSRKFLDKYIENQIDNILLHTDGGIYKLSDIKALTFEIAGEDEGRIKIVCNDNSTCVLYTKLGTGVEQGPMSTTALRNIAIDHVFPMKIILEEQEANLPALKRITQAFITSKLWQNHGKLKVKMIKDIGNDLLNKDLFNQTDIPALKEELNHIQRFIELQLMDANANLLKKAKFERNEEKKSPIS